MFHNTVPNDRNDATVTDSNLQMISCGDKIIKNEVKYTLLL